MRPLLAALLAAVLLLAGCMGGGEAPGAAADRADAAATGNHLLGAVEPEGDLEAPAFDPFTLDRGGPIYGVGEPSVTEAPDGTLYAAFLGCPEDVGPLMLARGSACRSGIVHRSLDGGRTWTRLNDENGALAKDAPRGNGDIDLAVDRAGNVYVSNLASDGIHTVRSRDGGESWTYTGNVVPEGAMADRNWMAAAAPGHVIHGWIDGHDAHAAKLVVVATFDGGDTYGEAIHLGEAAGWIGAPQFAPNGTTAYIPYTERVEPDALWTGGFELAFARTFDGGLTWTTHLTGVRTVASPTGLHGSGMLMAPNLDVTSDGTLVWAYSEESQDPLGLTPTKATLKLIASRDLGETWSEPLVLSARHNAIFPWTAAGAGDRAAVAYLASDVPLDPDRAGRWDVMVAVVDGVGTPGVTLVETVVDRGVHEGGACSGGVACFLKGGDRAMLDYFEMETLSDGRLVLAYPADPLAGGKHVEIRVAMQSGGSPLFLPSRTAA